jgi:hypothetical protein
MGQLEGLGQLKNQMTSPGIEPATFLLVSIVPQPNTLPWGIATHLHSLSEKLSFRTISIVLVLKTNQGKHEVSETGSVSVLRCGKNPILLGPLERASPNHWSSVSLGLFFNTRTMDRVRKLNISESYTPSSESYSNYFCILVQKIAASLKINRTSSTIFVLGMASILGWSNIFTGQGKFPSTAERSDSIVQYC